MCEGEPQLTGACPQSHTLKLIEHIFRTSLVTETVGAMPAQGRGTEMKASRSDETLEEWFECPC